MELAVSAAAPPLRVSLDGVHAIDDAGKEVARRGQDGSLAGPAVLHDRLSSISSMRPSAINVANQRRRATDWFVVAQRLAEERNTPTPTARCV